MTGVENILQRIIDEAKIAADEIIDQAELSAKDISEEYQSKIEFEQAKIFTQTKRNIADEERRLISLANLEARKITLATRQSLMNEAYDKALHVLNNMPSEQYIEVVLQLMLPYIKTGKEKVFLSADKQTGEAFKKALASRLPVGITVPEIVIEDLGEDGFVLKEGEIEMNCAFSALLKQYREMLEQQVAKTLTLA